MGRLVSRWLEKEGIVERRDWIGLEFKIGMVFKI